MHTMNKYYAIDNDPIFEAASIGELLRMVREKRGITLKEIAKSTRIHVGILINLEKNNLTELPSKPYVKGFVKSMAVYLGINPKRAIDMLEAAYYQLALENAPPVIPHAKSDHHFMQMLSDLKFPDKVPEISLQKVSGFFLVIVGIISIGAASNYVTRIYTTHNSAGAQQVTTTEAPLPVAPIATALESKIAPVKPAESTELQTAEPRASYPTAVSITFPKTLQTISADGVVMSINRTRF